ncbi:FirrV-1-B54 [Feldmannia irregularis virus a]|uniref:FirrV-1-B54 n=1 Tax=Feldmannia irregularis virus a TaxID=231992 RepID=Q6XLY2_9PHYC|nr:FirrV-1-B54 [Feldmannia irregularis virus a]AAR26929.1 FirrV-1-B54 [Feldmannia irregularis virus a]
MSPGKSKMSATVTYVSDADTLASEDSVPTDEEEDLRSDRSDTSTRYTLHPISREDVSIRQSTIPGAGMGVITKRPLQAGTILPYFTLIYKTSALDPDVDDTYFSSICYNNNRQEDKMLSNMIGDGNPHIKAIKKLRRDFRTAPYVNEAYDKKKPNTILMTNPSLTKDQIVSAYRSKTPIATSLLVVPKDIPKNVELLTLYGKSYHRNYPQWSGKKSFLTELVQIAHEITFELETDIAVAFS